MTPTKTTSEIKTLLNSLGIKCSLEQPPRNYVAVLQDGKQPQGLAWSFQIPERGSAIALHTLLSTYLGVKLIHAELNFMTLDFFLEDESQAEKEKRVSGKEVRYTLAGEAPKKRSRYQCDSPDWKHLDDNVTITFIKGDPFLADDDATTVAINLDRAKKSIEAKIQEKTTILKDTTASLEKAESALKSLES